MKLTQAEVQKLFWYEEETGRLVRKFSRGKGFAGTHSEAKDKNGYLVVGINKKLYRAHRVVWLYVHGEWPKGDIDHINGIKDDNRISNLRDVTRAENLQNQKASRKNTSGFKGVWFQKSSNRYVAVIESNRKRYYLGCFETPEEAASAYSEKAAVVHKYNPSAKT